MMKKAAALSRILKTAALLTGCALLFILPFGGLSARRRRAIGAHSSMTRASLS